MDRASLYDEDVVTWADEQVAELRRLARSAPTNAVDWENVIEEIESLGRSEWQGVQSQLTNVFAHILKGVCDPDSWSYAAWGAEVDRFLVKARRDYRNSMRDKINLGESWNDALEIVALNLARHRISVPPGLPRDCPFPIERVLAKSFTYEDGVAELARLVTSTER